MFSITRSKSNQLAPLNDKLFAMTTPTKPTSQSCNNEQLIIDILPTVFDAGNGFKQTDVNDKDQHTLINLHSFN